MTINCPRMRELSARLKEFRGSSVQAIARGMRAWGETTRTAAIKVTPKDWGTLRNTIFVDQNTTGEQTRLTIGAGGPAAPYAVVVHEKLSGVNWRTPGTGPKYLENPIRERMPKLDDRVAREVERETAKVAKA